MKKISSIFIDIFLISISIYIVIVSNSKLNFVISGISIGIWTCCLIFDIIEFLFKRNNTTDEETENM